MEAEAFNCGDDNILSLFHVRDQHEKAFTTVIESYNALVLKLASYVEQNMALQARAQTYEELHDKLTYEVTTLRELGSISSQKRTCELEGEIETMKEEQERLYKTLATNAQRLVEQNYTLASQEATLQENISEIQKLMEVNRVLAGKNHEMRDLIDEKDGTIQVLQDELSTTQLEVTKLDEKAKALQQGNEILTARSRQLEMENAELLEWRKKATEEADRMKAMIEATEEDNRYSSPLLSPALTPSFGRAFSFPAVAPPPVVTPTHASAPSSSSSYTHCSYDSESPTRGSWRGSWTNVSVIPLKSNKKMIAHDSEINAIAISNNGSMFATGSNDKTVKVWDVLTRSLKSTLHGCLQSVMCVAFNSTDDYILAGSNDNAARLWHLGTGRSRHTLTGHTGKVFAARFNPDSNKVITGSHDRSIKIWDVQRGYCVRSMFPPSSVNDVCLLDYDGSTIASGHMDCALRFWDSRSGNCVQEVTGIHQEQITSVSPTSDGFQVLTNSRDNTLRILDVRTYKTQVVLQAEGYKTGTNWSRACFSPDDQYVLAGSADGKLFYWSATDGILEKTAQDQKSPIVGVAWSHGTAVSAEKDRSVVVWNAIARRSVMYSK